MVPPGSVLRLKALLAGVPGEPLIKKRPIMTYRTCQNLLLVGSFLLLAFLMISPLLERGGRVDQLPELKTPTVAAASIVEVWIYKQTGLYYCPDSQFYGKMKPGAFVTQEKALESGYRPAANEPCRYTEKVVRPRMRQRQRRNPLP